jgi:hypothetical protein
VALKMKGDMSQTGKACQFTDSKKVRVKEQRNVFFPEIQKDHNSANTVI